MILHILAFGDLRFLNEPQGGINGVMGPRKKVAL